MKAKGFIWPLVILLGACNEKPAAEAGAGNEKHGKQASSASPSAGSEDADGAGKDGKSTARPGRAKKPAMGSVAQGQPGKAISPYSNEAVDVKGLAAGSLVQDPKFPGDESKKFVVPEGVEEVTEKPEAKPVPGRPGFVFSPYNNKLIDVKGLPAGSIAADPTFPASENKIFRIPAEAVAEEDAAEGEAEGGAVIGADGGALGGEGADPEEE